MNNQLQMVEGKTSTALSQVKAPNLAPLYDKIAMIEKIKLLDYVKEGTIKSITVNSRIDLTFLAVFFILLLTSYIFRYGEELQQQVDETL